MEALVDRLGAVYPSNFHAWRSVARIKQNAEVLEESMPTQDSCTAKVIVETCVDRNNVLSYATTVGVG